MYFTDPKTVNLHVTQGYGNEEDCVLNEAKFWAATKKLPEGFNCKFLVTCDILPKVPKEIDKLIEDGIGHLGKILKV